MPRKPNTSGEHYNDPFPTRLRSLIDERGVTQETIATVLGVKNRQSVTGYIDGNTLPTIDKVLALSKFFNVSTDYMLGVTDVKGYGCEYRAICDFTGLSETAVNILHDSSVYGKTYANFLPRLVDALCRYAPGESLLCEYISDDIARAADVSYKAESLNLPDGVDAADMAAFFISRASTIVSDAAQDILESMVTETLSVYKTRGKLPGTKVQLSLEDWEDYDG